MGQLTPSSESLCPYVIPFRHPLFHAVGPFNSVICFCCPECLCFPFCLCIFLSSLCQSIIFDMAAFLSPPSMLPLLFLVVVFSFVSLSLSISLSLCPLTLFPLSFSPLSLSPLSHSLIPCVVKHVLIPFILYFESHPLSPFLSFSLSLSLSISVPPSLPSSHRTTSV